MTSWSAACGRPPRRWLTGLLLAAALSTTAARCTIWHGSSHIEGATFVNQTDMRVQLYRVEPDGSELRLQSIGPGSATISRTIMSQGCCPPCNDSALLVRPSSGGPVLDRMEPDELCVDDTWTLPAPGRNG